MRFFVDEAGTFEIPVADQHRAAVAVTLAVSEHVWPTLVECFEGFVATLAPEELEGGEPKGRLLTSEHVDSFTDLLGDLDGICVTPVTMDLGHLTGTRAQDLVEPLRQRLEETVGHMVFPKAADQVALLARQTRNLSPQQILRLLTWARSLFEGIHHAIIFLSHGPHAESWHSVRIEIDPVQRQTGNREARFLSVMMYAWMVAWTVDRPFITLSGLHTSEHPFVRNFCSDDGVVLSDLVRPNLHWPESHDSVGLQIADIAATIVHQAVTDLNDENGAVTRFAALMRASPYGPARGPGLISPLTAADESLGDKYAVLSEAMERRRAASGDRP